MPSILTYMPLLTVSSDKGLINPEVSNEFNPVSHLGIDLMYPRRGTDEDPPTSEKGSNSRWLMFPGSVAHAPGDGKVIEASLVKRGHYIKLDHGDFYTNYMHLADLRVKTGDTIKAGAQLGQIGSDPTDPEGLIHLHWEIRHPNGVAIDPAPAWNALIAGDTWPKGGMPPANPGRKGGNGTLVAGLGLLAVGTFWIVNSRLLNNRQKRNYR